MTTPPNSTFIQRSSTRTAGAIAIVAAMTVSASASKSIDKAFSPDDFGVPDRLNIGSANNPGKISFGGDPKRPGRESLRTGGAAGPITMLLSKTGGSGAPDLGTLTSSLIAPVPTGSGSFVPSNTGLGMAMSDSPTALGGGVIAPGPETIGGSTGSGGSAVPAPGGLVLVGLVGLAGRRRR